MTRAPIRLLLLLPWVLLASPAALAQWANDDCMACHDGLTDDAGELVASDLALFVESIHGELDLACTDCHADLADAEDIVHDTPLAAAACGDCHVEEAEEHAGSVHGRPGNGHSVTAAGCADCHGAHDIRPADDPASRTYHFRLPATCGRCHSPDGDAAHVDPRFAVAPTFDDSIHGYALAEAGLIVAPSCATCHGVHDILPPEDPASAVSRNHVPDTCGRCHVGIEQQYDRGVHGEAVRAGNEKAPICVDCHSSHAIVRSDLPAWRRSVIQECGGCHEHAVETYRETYHGKIDSLGGTRVAACADCHGAHDIASLGGAEPGKSEARLGACLGCHPGAGASFSRYDPHPDPDDRERNPMLYWASRGMKSLLVFVFSFFFLHTGLWLGRSLRRGKPASGADPGEPK